MKKDKRGFLGIPVGRASVAEGALEWAAGERVWPVERWLLQRMLASLGNPAVCITLWNGESLRPAGREPAVGMLIRERPALWRLLAHPDLHFGDDFTRGRIEVEGGLVPFFEEVFRARSAVRPGERLPRLRQLDWARRNSLAGARQNIHHHYNIGNDFYRLWLDPSMAYTCAYYPSADATLEQAQWAKMEHICRKLRLKSGERVVEAGCGWGGLALHMARHHGVEVTAYNISAEQVRYARDKARAEGLGGRVDYVEDDYRNIRDRCDAFVSVGMLEHVGVENYAALGAVIDRCLAPHGRALIHTIGKNRPGPMTAWAERRIFPGAYPPTLGEMAAIFEPYAFSVVDVENLRLHYAQTLRHWLERFERNATVVEAAFDRYFVRAWRLYLSSSVASFSCGALQLFQVLFTRVGNNALPLTRAYLYRDGEGADGAL